MPNLPADEIRERVAALGPWFHNLDLAGVKTAPDHFLGDYPMVKWKRFSHVLPQDMTGKSVLDIGCNAGFYAFEMKRRGASRVVGIDFSPGMLEAAKQKLATVESPATVEFVEEDVMQMTFREEFDVAVRCAAQLTDAQGKIEDLNAALDALRGLPIGSVRVLSTGPGAYTVTIGAGDVEVRLTFDRDEATLRSINVGGGGVGE